MESKIQSLIGKKPWKEIITFQVEGNYAQLRVKMEIDASAKLSYEETLGRTILFTNQDNWSPEDVIWGYREQYLIEHAFRSMKDPKVIAVRPIFHSNNKCIEAHIFTCVLGLFLLSILRLKLSKRGIFLTYDQIITQLRDVHAVKIHLKSNNDTTIKMEKILPRTVKIVKLLHLEQMLSEEK